MNEKLKAWIAHIETVRPEMDSLAKRLETHSITVKPQETNTVGNLPYSARFEFGVATTTITFHLKDHETDSDVVITNMTTLPEDQCRKGYGSKSVQSLLEWATSNGLNEVRATQVSGQKNESFWQKNGFEKCQAPNPCNDFVFVTATKHRPT